MSNVGQVILGIDFDGTVVTHDYPEVGDSIGAESVLKEVVENGHKIVLWTMRSDNTLQDAVNWYMVNNIPLFGINENPEQHSWTDSPKAYCHLYIDDMALGAPLIHGDHAKPYIDWAKVREMLVQRGILKNK